MQRHPSRSPRLTARGEATRRRIVTAAADLMYAQGVAATSLDDVTAASGTGKSQLYHYFEDKEALVAEVIAAQIARVLESQDVLLSRFDSVRGLERWRDAEVLDTRIRNGGHGCPIGSLASELADQSESAREALAAGFAQWETYFIAGLARMRDNGRLRPDVNLPDLATGIIAALQGGLLLAHATRDPGRLAQALDLAVNHVRALAPN